MGVSATESKRSNRIRRPSGVGPVKNLTFTVHRDRR